MLSGHGLGFERLGAIGAGGTCALALGHRGRAIHLPRTRAVALQGLLQLLEGLHC